MPYGGGNDKEKKTKDGFIFPMYCSFACSHRPISLNSSVRHSKLKDAVCG